MTTEQKVTKDAVLEALKEVYDPEIPVNIVDLGLIYDVEVDDGEVAIEMTLTAQGCGMGPYIAQQAEWRIAEIEGVDRSGAPTLAAALEKIRSAEKARASTLIIQNNVPYANRLALGHSKVAPAGWVDEEINNALSIPGGVKDLG